VDEIKGFTSSQLLQCLMAMKLYGSLSVAFQSNCYVGGGLRLREKAGESENVSPVLTSCSVVSANVHFSL
jgi:hypothetical protein